MSNETVKKIRRSLRRAFSSRRLLHVAGAYAVLSILTIGVMPSAEAGLFDRDWKDDEINDVVGDVNTLISRTSGLPGKLTNLQNTANSIEGTVDGVKTTVDDVQTKVIDVQDKIAEIAETVQDQKGNLTDELLDLISDSLEELKTLAAEHQAGLGEFRGAGDDCSSVECIQFKSNITELFTNMESLSNTLLDQGVELSMDVDFAAINEVLDLLPASGLYPIYLATNREVNLFDSGLAELMGNVDADMRAVSGEEDDEGGITNPLSCEAMLARPDFYSKATDRLFAGGGAVRFAGRVVGSTGDTFIISKDLQVHGYVGISLDSDIRQVVGKMLENIGNGIREFAGAKFDNLRYCTLLDVQADVVGVQETLDKQCGIEIVVHRLSSDELRVTALTTVEGARAQTSEFDIYVGVNLVEPTLSSRAGDTVNIFFAPAGPGSGWVVVEARFLEELTNEEVAAGEEPEVLRTCSALASFEADDSPGNSSGNGKGLNK